MISFAWSFILFLWPSVIPIGDFFCVEFYPLFLWPDFVVKLYIRFLICFCWILLPSAEFSVEFPFVPVF